VPSTSESNRGMSGVAMDASINVTSCIWAASRLFVTTRPNKAGDVLASEP
jgi:hypothetical protein